MSDNDRYMMLSTCSIYIHLQPSTLYNMVCTKKIPYCKAGARLLFDRDEIDDWLVHVEPIGANNTKK